jgi:hypothetical protein
MSPAARGFWWWVSVVLIAAAVSGACFPRAATNVLLVEFMAGMVIGILCLLGPPSGPDAVGTGETFEGA